MNSAMLAKPDPVDGFFEIFGAILAILVMLSVVLYASGFFEPAHHVTFSEGQYGICTNACYGSECYCVPNNCHAGSHALQMVCDNGTEYYLEAGK